MESDFTVVLPCLNELDNLVGLLPELEKLGCEIIVCDNGSCDGGLEYIRCCHKDVRVSQGWGTVVDAIQRGLTLASHDKVVIMDSDQSHPTSAVPHLVFGLKNNDLVVGRRTHSGDTLRNRIISRGFNILAWGLAPNVEDRASGFWGVRKSFLNGTKIRNTTKPMLEYIVRGRINKIYEVGYKFKPRQAGYSKIGKPIFREFYSLGLLYLFKYQRPLKFCLVGGSGALLQVGLLALFTEVFSLFYIMSAVVAIILVTIWNYIFNNFWTFKQKELM